MADIARIGACGVVIAISLRWSRRIRRNRRVWVREWVRNRPQFGAYHQLVQELRLAKCETYRHFLCMDMDTFDKLLRLVGPHISYQDTNMWQAISPRERLALTLRFLAIGEKKAKKYLNSYYLIYILQMQEKPIPVYSTCIEFLHKL